MSVVGVDARGEGQEKATVEGTECEVRLYGIGMSLFGAHESYCFF